MEESGTAKTSLVQKHQLVQNLRLENHPEQLFACWIANVYIHKYKQTDENWTVQHDHWHGGGLGGTHKISIIPMYQHVAEILLACSNNNCVQAYGVRNTAALLKFIRKQLLNMWLIGAFYVSSRWVYVMWFMKFNLLNKTTSVFLCLCASKTPNTFLPGQVNQFIPLQWYHVLRVDKVFLFIFLVTLVSQKLIWAVGFYQKGDMKDCFHGIICLWFSLFFALIKHGLFISSLVACMQL